MLKIQLDLETLEKLIGRDTPFQAEIREGIIQTFTKRHLRSLVNSPSLQEIANEVKKELHEFRKECMAEVVKHLPVKNNKASYPNYKSWFQIDKTHPGYVEMIEVLKSAAIIVGSNAVRCILDELKDEMKKNVEYKRKHLVSQIREEVERQITNNFEKSIDIEIKRRLKRLAQDAMKEDA